MSIIVHYFGTYYYINHTSVYKNAKIYTLADIRFQSIFVISLLKFQDQIF